MYFKCTAMITNHLKLLGQRCRSCKFFGGIKLKTIVTRRFLSIKNITTFVLNKFLGRHLSAYTQQKKATKSTHIQHQTNHIKKRI